MTLSYINRKGKTVRIRYLKNTVALLEESTLVEENPAARRGNWQEAFKDSTPGAICLEIGCGKGRFICEMAAQYPQQKWIGVERMSTVLARTVRQFNETIAAGKPVPENVRLIRYEAINLDEVFAPGEVNQIYLNFSDPWPKDKHAKRRLTSERFLPLYRRLLTPDGFVQFKTDNDDLFAFSVENFEKFHWEITDLTHDLHQSPYVEGNVMTEYEENFVALGKKIHYLKARPL